jgi:subtilisin family serine protease
MLSARAWLPTFAFLATLAISPATGQWSPTVRQTVARRTESNVDFSRAWDKLQDLAPRARPISSRYVVQFATDIAFALAHKDLVEQLQVLASQDKSSPHVARMYKTSAVHGVAVIGVSDLVLEGILECDFVELVTPVRCHCGHSACRFGATLILCLAYRTSTQDHVYELDFLQMPASSWGLDRLDDVALPMDGSYHYEHTGAHVNVYVVDTGLYREHEDFGNLDYRNVTCGFDAFAQGIVTTMTRHDACVDTDGHGTHVAGIIGGFHHGVSKHVNLIAVKVHDTDQGGSLTTVLAGLDYILEQETRTTRSAQSHSSFPAIVNLSLGGPKSNLMNAAVDALVQAGVLVVASAGNEATSSCTKSPASSDLVLSVSATNRNDEMTPYANHGLCTNLWAPGHDITSAWIRSAHDAVRLSGTSLAAPHVTGGTYMQSAAMR